MVANLHLTLLDYTWRKSMLQQEITELMSTKRVYTNRTADTNALYSAKKADVREYYQELYKNNPEFREMYADYRDIPGYEEELAEIAEQLQRELDELSNHETELDNEITKKSTEMKEIQAYEESFKQMLSNRIQSDYNFGSIGGG